MREFHETESRVPKMGYYEEFKIMEEIKRRRRLKMWEADKTKQDIRKLNKLFQNRSSVGKSTAMVEFAKASDTVNEDEGDEGQDDIAELGFYGPIDGDNIGTFEQQPYFPQLLDMKKARSFLIPNRKITTHDK